MKGPLVKPEMLEIPPGNEIFDGYRAAFQKYGFAPAVRSRGFLFISGQVGVRPDGQDADSVAEQTEWALMRIKELLRIAGLDFTDLVDVTSYHVDIENTLPEFMEAKSRFIKSPFPAWSIIGISGLSRPALKVEIRAVASLRD